ncbi:hypothetical protein EST38_g3416 [Candolleomyces aberdarensis]|uniref:Fungal-type protein kinase domain-containing protein n=1 Tax=Candolleomyces aberdarensis TaxID=2316362 RepID=A0A4Q2DPX1_9AGAR|nr:hypothetical protein EST38_g3416 [Candolleomyces aberdarensis]
MASTSTDVMAGSTPLRESSKNRPARTVKEERLFSRSDIEPYTHTNIGLVDFAVHVWGVKREHAELIIRTDFKLDRKQQKKYDRVCKIGPETGFHEPFRKMSEQLLYALAKKLPQLPRPSFPHVFWDGKGVAYLKRASGDAARKGKKPDLLSYFTPPPNPPKWPTTKGPVEFKLFKENALASIPEHQVLPSVVEVIPAATATASRGKSKRSSANKIVSAVCSSDETNESGKRTHSSAGLGSEEYDSSNKRAKLVQSHLQVGSYAVECLASTSRYYVVCVVIENYRVEVLYFDRTTALRVIEFNFRAQVGHLALVLYGIDFCDRRHAGFDPHLQAWPPQSSTTRVRPTKAMVAKRAKPVESLIGSFFEFQETSKPTEDIVMRDADADKSKVEEEDTGTGEVITHQFRVRKVITTPNSDLIGRGTMVCDVQKVLEGNKLSSDHYALKLSWPLKVRPSEIEIIDHLRAKLPDLCNHLPYVEFSKSFTAQDLDLPWTKLGLTLTAANHQERLLRVISSKLYIKLWKAGSVEAFKQAWLDCLECHERAWEEGDVLHRDLTENNLMLYRKKDGNVKGVLNDWDMASFKNALGTIDRLLAAHHRTGTPPFMAIDLLSKTPPPHLYRHELESFFYILLWGALHYDVVAGVRHRTLTVMEKWDGDYKDIGNMKIAFFNNYPTAQEIFKHVRPEFQGLLKEWIIPLYVVISDAWRSRPMELNEAAWNAYDHETLNGRLTFKTFMAAIKMTPRFVKSDNVKV